MMSNHKFEAGRIMLTMRGTGTVQNPDGTTHQVVLEATRPLSETEMARLKAAEPEGANHGDYTERSSGDGRSQRGLQRDS